MRSASVNISSITLKAENIDLAVMTTHGHSGLARLVFGSVANKVMHDVNVPVLVIRPDLE